MSTSKKIVCGVSNAEVTEKKSRFIASCRSISSEEEALSLIAAERKRYFDARHTCFAYVCGDNNETVRFSDDGEPRGTAGKPILDIITGNNLKNALITVTRYFGGTLLGTGGLVRAYSSSAAMAVEEGIASGTILESEKGAVIKIELAYKDIGRFEHLCQSLGVQTDDKYFGENAVYTLLVRSTQIQTFKKDVSDLTNGNAKIEEGPLTDFVFKSSGSF